MLAPLGQSQKGVAEGSSHPSVHSGCAAGTVSRMSMLFFLKLSSRHEQFPKAAVVLPLQR